MDIDDTTGLSPNGSPVRGGTGASAAAGVGNTSVGSDDGSGAGSDPDWSTDDWMVDMRRVKARLLLPVLWFILKLFHLTSAFSASRSMNLLVRPGLIVVRRYALVYMMKSSILPLLLPRASSTTSSYYDRKFERLTFIRSNKACAHWIQREISVLTCMLDQIH
jgi:hypothetical protein